MSILKTPRDRELFQKWNDRLKKYDDCNAEDFDYTKGDGERTLLYDWHSFRFKKVSPEKFEQTRLYYANCRELLNTHKFKTLWQKKIWALYSEGLSCREISRKINSRYKKTQINKIIRDIIKELALK